jgi:hypothetical protein
MDEKAASAIAAVAALALANGPPSAQHPVRPLCRSVAHLTTTVTVLDRAATHWSMRWAVTKSASLLLSILWLLGCGGRAHSGLAEGSNSMAGGTALSGSGGTAGAPSTSGTGGASLGASGAAGATGPDEPDGPMPQAPQQIPGRWALFSFDDPVGVKLVQTDGNLVGSGCAAGTPPLGNLPSFCGDLVGKVEGNQATFGFSFEGYRYVAETLISVDGTRMTGRFHAVDWIDYPTAWLRVPENATYLEMMGTLLEPEELAGWYDLELVEADGGEYQAGIKYPLHYSRRSIAGALGCFWGTEASDPALGSPIRVGPVPATSPELPTDLQIEFADAGLRDVRATTASGHVYSFTAKRTSP